MFAARIFEAAKMNEPFSVRVSYQGAERQFKARYERYGYTHRYVAALISYITVDFEPDEEGRYRALGNTPVKTDVLQKTAEKLMVLSPSTA